MEEKADVGVLRLDPENPRLPEELQGKSQSEMFEYYYRHGVLDELMDSMLDNGFFEHEPLICLPADSSGERVVVEGNRRLATLFLIHEAEAADGCTPFREASEAEREMLREVPIFEVEDREEVRSFLGFRHISGLKPWSPESKARYLAAAVERAVEKNVGRPFLEVAREVGSNTQGVRNAYVALRLLRFARDECSASTGYVLSERFGVWVRCMNAKDIRTYVGLGGPKTFEEVESALTSVDCERLAEVVHDLSPAGSLSRPVLSDSRDVTQYGLVLLNDRAHAVLRKYDDLQLAKQVVVVENYPQQVQRLAEQVSTLQAEIAETIVEADQELVAAAESLARSAKLLAGVVHSLEGGVE